jgi:hypothetical protein
MRTVIGRANTEILRIRVSIHILTSFFSFKNKRIEYGEKREKQPCRRTACRMIMVFLYMKTQDRPQTLLLLFYSICIQKYPVPENAVHYSTLRVLRYGSTEVIGSAISVEVL